MTMAYKGIMGRDTGMPMPMGITCVAVAAGCSAAGIGRPSAGIGRVISGKIGRSWLESPEILGRRGRACALTAAPAGGKLILPRFGEALTLRLSPRGISLSVNGGATFGPPLRFS